MRRDVNLTSSCQPGHEEPVCAARAQRAGVLQQHEARRRVLRCVSYNNKPIGVGQRSRSGTASTASTPRRFSIFRLAELDWIEVGGDVLYRISGGDVDAVGATLYAYQEFGVKVRNANAAFLNLNE
jgi:hypothetical protein